MGSIRTITCFLLIFFCVNEALSQFNDTTNYYVNFASTGIVNKTNNRNAFVLNNNFKFSLYKKNASANITQSWIYGKQSDVLTNQDFSSALDFSLFETFEHFYYWGLGTYEKSFSLKINHRSQAGLGIGYNIIDRKNSLVVISDGILYEKSDLFDNAEAGNNEYETYRNSFRLKFRFLIGDIISIDGVDYLQHSLSDRSDYIIRSNTNVSLKLLRWLSFTTSLTYNKLSRTGRENLLINLGVTMERYF